MLIMNLKNELHRVYLQINFDTTSQSDTSDGMDSDLNEGNY